MTPAEAIANRDNFPFFIEKINAKRPELGEIKVLSRENGLLRYIWHKPSETVESSVNINLSDYERAINIIICPKPQVGKVYRGVSPNVLNKQYRNRDAIVRNTAYEGLILGITTGGNPRDIRVEVLPKGRTLSAGMPFMHFKDEREYTFDKDKVKARLTAANPKDALESLIDSINNLAFIENVEVIGKRIKISYKNPPIDMGMHEGKKLTLLRRKGYVMLDLWNSTPLSYPGRDRISWGLHVFDHGGICSGTYGSYFQKNKSDILGQLINYREHLCTYNPSSPTFRPRSVQYDEYSIHYRDIKQADPLFGKVIRGDEDYDLLDILTNKQEQFQFTLLFS